MSNQVQELIGNANISIRRIQTHAAAYGAMMRLLELPDEERVKQAPVFVWPARGFSDDSPVEIQTDLAALDIAQLTEVIRSVASVHYSALYGAAQNLAQGSQSLLQCFTPEQPAAPPPQPATPVAPVPAPAPAPDSAPVPTSLNIPPVATTLPGTPAPGTIQSEAQAGGESLVAPSDVGRPPAPGGPASQ